MLGSDTNHTISQGLDAELGNTYDPTIITRALVYKVRVCITNTGTTLESRLPPRVRHLRVSAMSGAILLYPLECWRFGAAASTYAATLRSLPVAATTERGGN